MNHTLCEPPGSYKQALGVGLLLASLSSEIPPSEPVDPPLPAQASRPEAIGSGPVRFLPVSPLRETSRFGPRADPFTGKNTFHTGIDLAAPLGTWVFAVGSGVVAEASFHRGYGLFVEIDHGGGYSSRYAHLSKVTVSRGEQVIAGQEIGRVGSSGRASGPHLHFELRKDRKVVDPRRFL